MSGGSVPLAADQMSSSQFAPNSKFGLWEHSRWDGRVSACVSAIPHLQVLARSSPTDKFTLVSLLRKQGEVVAVTGDGMPCPSSPGYKD